MLKANEWLSTPPPEDSIETIDGVKVIRQEVLEQMLDELTNFTWSTENYKSKIINYDGEDYMSASLELVVRYSPGELEDDITRRLVGAYTFKLSHFEPNTFFDNTAKSLCTGNAASDLGKRFGRGLNNVEPVVPGSKSKAKTSVKIKPDKTMIDLYNSFVEKGDSHNKSLLEKIYDFATD